MKRKLKAFTLVELIVVMAIMSILMLALMQMFKPIRETYVDSTQYEAQRTAQNGVVQYITESVKYATDMGIYNDGVSSAHAAVQTFADAYCISHAVDPTKVADVKKEIEYYAEVIVIDNTTTHYSKHFTGRLLRRKVNYSTPQTWTNPSFNSNDAKTVNVASKWRTALSESYYGENTYYITLDTDDFADGMLTVSVASTKNGKRDISRMGKEKDFVDFDGNTLTSASSVQTAINSNKIAVTRGGVLCRNLTNNSSNGVKLGVTNKGMFDADKTAPIISGKSYSGPDNTKDVYIVFLSKEGKDKVLAKE